MVYSLNKKDLIKIYSLAHLIRNCEEKIASEYHKGEMRCPTHLSIGQELVPSVISLYTNKQDYVVSTHRAHAHYLAKGGSLKKMIAEIYGKKNGCSGGKGGSMHLVDNSCGFVGTSAIVANSIPLGVGLSMSIKLNKSQNVCITYLGDGAVEEGVFYESINFAVIKNLPIIFICENNLFSVYSNLTVRQPIKREIYRMVKGMGIDSFKCNGYNLNSTNKLLKKISYIRKKPQPLFLEFETYRWREHCGPNYDDDLDYRNPNLLKKKIQNDPLLNLKKTLSKGNNYKIVDEIESQNMKYIKEAFQFAKKSKFPSKKSLTSNLYKNYA